nr:migration and invasion-inhibitory protein isoform X2 [Dasypus novemcinctus]XP_058160356.1 migration and invasion-inhibitory protein isoform X2 [Dasypus novemcinctus]XP_058160357.1 migration and invasion-inhibitory protein isoform X2 [Dasypus novemcinctus]
MVEAEDLEQLRQLNLELLRRLWVGQDAVRRSVTEASLESSLDSSSSPSTATPASQETASTAPRASCPQRECHVPAPLVAHREDSCDVAWPGRASSGVVSLPLPKCHPWESLHRLRPHSAPVTSSLNDPELSAGPDSLRPREAQAQGSILAPRESKMCKPESMFSKESAEAKNSWYLDYDWTAGSLDSSSRLASKPEAFFSKLQRFREANKEECVSSGPEWQLTDQQESSDVEGDHECVYCYRVSRRLFLVPADPGTPCRLCGTLRDQRGPKALAGPAQVRVTMPLSVLEPPHRHRIHRRKSFDASDTLALPRHCLLGWDIIPPKPEKCTAPRSLDLWSSVTSEAQYQKLSATSPSRLVGCRPCRSPGAGEGQAPGSRPGARRVPSEVGSGWGSRPRRLPCAGPVLHEPPLQEGPPGSEVQEGRGAGTGVLTITRPPFTIQALPPRAPRPSATWSKSQVPWPWAPLQRSPEEQPLGGGQCP